MTEDVQSPRTAPPTSAPSDALITTEGLQHDYTSAENGIVPLAERKPLFHFAALWLTLESGFTYIVPGIALHSAGFSLLATVGMLLLGMALYLAYGMAAAHLGARTGQTVALLSRSVLGSVGSGVVSVVLIFTQTGWAGFQAYFTITLLDGLFGWDLGATTTMAWACVAAVLMVVNNVVGFQGIAVFARRIVTPILLAWTVYLVLKGIVTDGGQLTGTPPEVAPLAVGPAIALIIGTAIWGAEADIWRYSPPRPRVYLVSYGFAFLAGVTVSGIGGWIAAELVTRENPEASTALGDLLPWMTDYSLFGLSILMAVIVVVVQVSLNDGNYYESINAIQNLLSHVRGWSRYYACALVAVLGVLATLYINSGSNLDGFAKIATLGAIGSPCATIIMATDHFVLPRLLGISRPLVTVPTWTQSARINLPGLLALVLAVSYGVVTTGVFNSFTQPSWYWADVGIAALETWVLAALLYVLGALLSQRGGRDRTQTLLGFPAFSRGVEHPARPVDVVEP
ncbi:cytosine permease [Phycicoccus avicenniae]|uniref:cytosine permease n=1 Tax=Phycicoccus avicenniae TaxID=2828860 RepID=UPI003D269FC9